MTPSPLVRCIIDPLLKAEIRHESYQGVTRSSQKESSTKHSLNTHTMSTRARIGILLKDLSVESVYHHWDGYPEWLGVTLKEHYNTHESVAKLIDGGNMSSCYSDNEFDYEKQEFVKQDPKPNYYGGDDERPHLNSTIQMFLRDAYASEEYLYLFCSREVIEANWHNVRHSIFGVEGWHAWSVRPMYNKDYSIRDTDVTPVEIPAFDVADAS